MQRKFWMPVALLFLLGGILAIAAPVVVVDGGMAHVRTLMSGGVPYVAAPDIAKAFGKKFQLVGGKFVFGALGGKSVRETAVTEFGKWAFNGKLRMRVTEVGDNLHGCGGYSPHSFTVEIANATHSGMRFGPSGPPQNLGVSNDFSIYKSGQTLAHQGIGDYVITQLNPGDHVMHTFCYGGSIGDLLEVSTGHDLGFGKERVWPVMKFKLTK